MNHFIAPGWPEIFQFNRLVCFDDFWALASDWFEPPNHRRGGWSGAARVRLSHPNGGDLFVFIKKQENHRCWTWRHPVAGEPTLHREFQNLRRFQQHRIPAPELLYFARSNTRGKDRAMLITLALEDFKSLHELVLRWSQDGWPEPPRKRRILRRMAEAVRIMHRRRRQHNCLFPKHIFLRFDQNDVEVRFIDLEKTKYRPRSLAMYRDLGTLLNRSATWSKTDRLYFLKQYLNVPKLEARGKRIWRRLARQSKI
jgi:hypothetical protein